MTHNKYYEYLEYIIEDVYSVYLLSQTRFNDSSQMKDILLAIRKSKWLYIYNYLSYKVTYLFNGDTNYKSQRSIGQKLCFSVLDYLLSKLNDIDWKQ